MEMDTKPITRIIDALEERGPMTIPSLAEHLNRAAKSVNMTMLHYVNKGDAVEKRFIHVCAYEETIRPGFTRAIWAVGDEIDAIRPSEDYRSAERSKFEDAFIADQRPVLRALAGNVFATMLVQVGCA